MSDAINPLASWGFHHVAVAVVNMEKAVDTYRRLGYEHGDIVDDPLQNVRLAMCVKDGVQIELVAPLNAESPVNGYLKSSGAGPYHTCYSCKDFEQAQEDLRASGIRFRVVSPPKSAILFDGARVMFLHLPHIGLVELLEESERR